jgi:hypothetical protein
MCEKGCLLTLLVEERKDERERERERERETEGCAPPEIRIEDLCVIKAYKGSGRMIAAFLMLASTSFYIFSFLFFLLSGFYIVSKVSSSRIVIFFTICFVKSS